MAKPEIGKIACPCCGEDASVREQKNGRAYLLCNSVICGFQGFTRSADADKAMRGRMRPNQEQPPQEVKPPTPDQLNKQGQQQVQPPKKRSFFDDLANL